MAVDTAQDETDDPNDAAERIEAALDRIERHIDRAKAPSAELAARLDRLIERLRAALDQAPV